MSTTQYNGSEDRAILGTDSFLFSKFVRPSRSHSPEVEESDRECFSRQSHAREYISHPDAPSDESTELEDIKMASCQWMPYTFRPYYIGLLSLVALGLCLVTFFLWWKSSNNYGLGPDNGSSSLLFGWRYSPTMIAVIYIQFTTMLFDDVKRTEPYARLARTEGSKASSSILQIPGPWWVALYDGFAKKNGRRSKVLIFASLLNILGILAISPLSSAYLYSEDLIVPQSREFYRLAPISGSPLPIGADRSTHFRALSNLLQNVSTSPWITNNYTILPFWPTTEQNNHLDSLPSDSSEKWQAETTMFKSELSCTKMKVDSQTSGKWSYNSGLEKIESLAIDWSSHDGCKYGIKAQMDFFKTGGCSWSNSSTFFYGADIMTPTEKSASSTSSTECRNREVIVATEPWTNMSGSYVAHLCDTKYYMANITATVALSGMEPEISFNEDEFQRNKALIPETLVNTTDFQDLMLNEDWASYMISILWAKTAMMGGGAVLLGALYYYNTSNLVHDPDLVLSAGNAKQRYFGEVLQASLDQGKASQKVSMQGSIHSVQTRVVVQAGPAIALGVLFAISFILLLSIWFFSRLRQRPLNLDKDPATTVGVAYLIAQSPEIQSIFSMFKQPSTNNLQANLAGEYFYTDSRGLFRTYPVERPGLDTTQSENGTPMLLRLPALLGLSLSLALVVVGVSILYHYAESAVLYGKAFVYQIQLSVFNSGMSSVAPFSIIPTVIAVGIGLWWSAIDDNFRRLQPFLSMTRGDPAFQKGVDLSYQTCYWFWAAGKAASNKHWLLLLVTLGSTLSPVYTTAMSALFERGNGNIIQPVTLHRQLELRQIPFVYKTQQSIYPSRSNDYVAPIIASLFTNISSYWMYTATIQLTLNGSEPAWSKDGWNFVPVDVSDITASRYLSNIGASKADGLDEGSQTNITFDTPAIRGRIECSPHPEKAFMNMTNWLTPTDLTDHTTWSKSTIPEGINGGYLLGASWDTRGFPSYIYPLLPGQNYTSCPGCTPVFANPTSIICCGNGSTDSRQGDAAVGYWSPNGVSSTWTPRKWDRNFTTKWFYGNAVTGIKMANDSLAKADAGLLFLEPPSISMLNCKPITETANARVTVNPSNGEIQSYNITDQPEIDPKDFSDNFLPHNQSITHLRDGVKWYNVTLSYGRIFTTAIMTAADTMKIAGSPHVLGYNIEDLDDNTYTIRDEMNGLNMDFMTYSMFTMAGKDPKALLDPDTFLRLAQKTYTTFFQHYVSNNVSMQTGGWAYQKINASLPSGIGPAVQLEYNYLPGTKATAYQDEMHPISHTNRTVEAHVSQRVELLQMNAVAVWLSIGIMAWLILTTIVVVVLQKRYFGSLVRNVECLGDVLVMIAGSANFLQVVREIRAGRLLPESYEHLRTKLGWFVDEDGGVRWGIEMEESYGDGPGVHWIPAPHFSKEKGTKTWNLRDEERDL